MHALQELAVLLPGASAQDTAKPLLATQAAVTHEVAESFFASNKGYELFVLYAWVEKRCRTWHAAADLKTS